MMLHCTLVAAPGSDLTAGPLELAVDVPAPCSGAELQRALSRRYGTGELTVDRIPVAALTVGEAPLVPGAVLVDGIVGGGDREKDRAARPAAGDAAALVLAVHSGPAAGLLVALRRGRFRIGRSNTDVAIPDAELSRDHAQLEVSDSAVTLLDLGSANGTTVDAKRVHAAAISTESLFRCGGSSMSLVFGGAAVGGSLAPGVPAAAGSDVSEPLTVSNPAAGSNRRALVLAAVLPLALGTGLAVATGMWIFLAFTAVSAVSVLVPVAAGRRQRRELGSAVAAAARQDAERRRRAAPSAGELSLRCCFSGPGGMQGPAVPGPVWLRLGQAPQRANIRLDPPDPGFRAPPLGMAPVTLDPATAVTALRGPEPAVSGLLRSILLQLACYPAAGRTRILIHGPAPALLPARFLAAATLSGQESSTLEALAGGPGGEDERGVLIIAGSTATAALRAAAVAGGWQVIDCGGDPAADVVLVLSERTGRLSTARKSVEFIPDLVPAGVFDRNCRRLGGSAPVTVRAAGIPGTCPLGAVLPLGAPDIARRWAESSTGGGLPVVVGVGRSGPLCLDLQADGPHVLVAGTTGSGKSEFLRTLAAALAAAHPPSRVNVLFIDFKGGSGLGPLAGLAHCVGLLTDLESSEVSRALVSLAAEVRRREELLAAHRAADLTAYESLHHGGPPLPHLVLIIDEFRLLVDEAPAALAELMRIAAIGRSLGIHLVMATQRPQGAISADIRANVTSRIALRVQSDPDSLDVINSRLAATIPITVPGRAYLVRGNEAPEEFQTATVTAPTREPVRGPTVMPAMEFFNRPPDGTLSGQAAAAAPEPDPGLARLVGAVNSAWSLAGGGAPRRPVAAPLPQQLPFPSNPVPPDQLAPDVAAPGRPRIRLGLLDVPEEQRVAEFGWLPGSDGHLAVVAGTAGGADAVLKLVVEQLLHCRAESHVYVLDAAGLFGTAATAARVGAVAGPHELRRAARVLERLAEEMTRRLGAPDPLAPPAIVLVLCGWGSWASAFRAGPLAWAEDLVQDLVRDGARAGITVVAAGGRELVTARFFAALPNRIFLPAGSSEEERLAWPRLPAVDAGRVAVFGPMSPAASAAGHVGQLFGPVSPGVQVHDVALAHRPFRVEPLPGHVTVSEVRSRAGGTPRNNTLRLGLGGDELLPAGIRLPRGGTVAVLGGAASGKSSLLLALPGLNPGASWLRAPDTGAERYWSGIHDAALSGTLDPAAILLADDLDLQPAETGSRMVSLNSLGWRVVFTAGFSPGIRQRVPLALTAANQGRGILIAPRTLLDGELFGVRFDVGHSPPPGRAVVIADGRTRVVQLACEA
ncbi:FtsK/SpoIIIE domain-containing protein [Pseudarthrobacter sp. 1C304]|uniref:FtsK/SpoIIIE domain-containing protein n=1 Tax=Pseudarthrobacter sp. 1C304 TaxID=3457438 RepID=UPI003FD32576